MTLSFKNATISLSAAAPVVPPPGGQRLAPVYLLTGRRREWR